MRPRILIVEDDEDQLEGNERDLRRISDEQKSYCGIEGFSIDLTQTKTNAIERLEEALNSASPYDLVLLDLKLPVSSTNPKKSPENGLEVLRFAVQKKAAKGVMIASVFGMYEWVVKCFREGAVDFIAKPFKTETLQTQVLKYFEKEGQRILEQRVEILAPHAEKSLAYRLGICFSRFVQSVVNETEGLQEGFKERWGLDIIKDSTDSQVRHLVFIDDAVRMAKREWAGAVSQVIVDSTAQNELPSTYFVEDVLLKLKDYVAPSLALKGVTMTLPEGSQTPVRSFKGDVNVILQEIVLGALTAGSNHDEPAKSIALSVTTNQNRVEVAAKDNFDSLSEETIEAINEGVLIPATPSFDRAWGLSVVHQIAKRSGGRINLRKEDGFNVITYSIPLAEHA
jgi:CheY-like chemotaxis protein